MSLKKIGIARYLVTATVRDKIRGYPVSAQKTVKGTLAEARIEQGKLLEKLRAKAGSLKPAVIGTFSEAVDVYLDKLRAAGRGSRTHLQMVERMRRDLGHIKNGEFSVRFEAYIKALKSGVSQYGRPFGASAINQHIATARAVYNHLFELEAIDRNPVTRARFPLAKCKARKRHLTQEERLRLFTAARDVRPEILPLIQYIMMVPCRISEVATARKEQYSPISGTIFIPDSKAGVSIYKPVPECMREYFETIPQDCPYLFYWKPKTWDGYKPWKGIQKVWFSICKAAGIADLHIHDLRHMAVTDLIAASNPAEWVALVAGWTSTAMLKVYLDKESLASSLKIRFGQEVATMSLQTMSKDVNRCKFDSSGEEQKTAKTA